jgi:hypothetical protein
MRTYTALAALLLLALSALHVHATAGSDTQARAQLRLLVLDRTQAPLPGATVTVFTVDGNPGTTVTADDKGIAQFPVLPAGLVQVYVRFPGFTSYAEKATLKGGANKETVVLELAPFREHVTVVASPETLAGS